MEINTFWVELSWVELCYSEVKIWSVHFYKEVISNQGRTSCLSEVTRIPHWTPHDSALQGTECPPTNRLCCRASRLSVDSTAYLSDEIMCWHRDVISNRKETSCLPLMWLGFDLGRLRNQLLSRLYGRSQTDWAIEERMSASIYTHWEKNFVIVGESKRKWRVGGDKYSVKLNFLLPIYIIHWKWPPTLKKHMFILSTIKASFDATYLNRRARVQVMFCRLFGAQQLSGTKMMHFNLSLWDNSIAIWIKIQQFRSRNAFHNVVGQMAAILFQPQCVNDTAYDTLYA